MQLVNYLKKLYYICTNKNKRSWYKVSKDWSMLLNFVKGNTMQPIDIMDIIEIMMDEYGFTLDTIQPQEGNSRYFEVGFSDYNSKTMQNRVIVGTGDLV